MLADPGRVCPAYDAAQGYEIAGLVWLQGWNDMVDRNAYPIPPLGGKANRYAKYSEWLADFIRDVRKDIGAPKMPFVIGVMVGVGGAQPNEHITAFREVMTAPALLSELKGNVIAVPTAPFWSEELGAIADKYERFRAMAFALKSKNKNGPNKDGTMAGEQHREYLKKFDAGLITPA